VIELAITATMEGARGKVRRLSKMLEKHFRFLDATAKNEWARIILHLLAASLTGQSRERRVRDALKRRGERRPPDALKKACLVRCTDEDRYFCLGKSNVLIVVSRDSDAAGSALQRYDDNRVVVWAALADGGRSVRVSPSWRCWRQYVRLLLAFSRPSRCRAPPQQCRLLRLFWQKLRLGWRRLYSGGTGAAMWVRRFLSPTKMGCGAI
jgi:hypothetical protein